MGALSARSAWLIAIGFSLEPAVSNGLARFAYGLMLPAMRQNLSWTYTEAGWINTANALGYLIGAGLTLALVATTVRAACLLAEWS
jgi:predicted MFS family arabinose efflux permease